MPTPRDVTFQENLRCVSLLLTLLVLLCTTSLHAATPTSRPATTAKKTQTPSKKQTKRVWFRGWVYQKGRRRPIDGAGVFIRELRRGVYTDEKGFFSIKLPKGTYSLIIKPMGFLTLKQKLVIKQDTKRSFYVLPDPKNPFQSVVKEKREQQAPEQLKIQRDEIRNMPGALGGDPIRALQNLPGIATNRGLSGSLRIRGASPADTGFYLDGHRIPLLYHFNGGPSLINDRFIQGIDFFPGGAPVSFGRMTSGLVSVNSRDLDATRWRGELYVDLIHAGFFLEIPITKQFSIALSARRSYVDAFIPLITTDALTAYYWDYQLKLSYKLRDHQFSLFVFGSEDFVDYKGQLDGEEVPFLDDDPLSLTIRFLRAILRHRFIKGPITWTTSIATGFDFTSTEEPNRSYSLTGFPIEYRSELRIQPHKIIRIDVGAEGGWQRQQYSFRFPVNEFAGFPKPSFQPINYEGDGEKDLWTPGFYLNTVLKPFKGFRFNAGIRADYYYFQEIPQWGFDPRVSFQWRFLKKWTLLGSVGIFHRPPDIIEWSKELGNPQLGLQGATQYTVGAKYQPFKKLNVRLIFYYNDMFDRISGSGKVVEVDGKLTRENYNNQGIGRGIGMELLVRLRNWNGLSSWVSYTLSRSERGTISNGLNRLYGYDQTHILNVVAQYKFGWGWSASLRFRLVSGRPTTPVIGASYDADTDRYRPIYGETDSERYPTFHQLDLRIDKKWTFNTWVLGVYLEVMNVYYSQITERYRYQFDYKKRFPQPGLPTLPSFGLRGEF
ncbi:MAG: hypothetical protein CL932_14610 [Deltaproteobacteria bacterium]|nr:hypothetical protein [Deltaproteobacteria bacterium]